MDLKNNNKCRRCNKERDTENVFCKSCIDFLRKLNRI